MTEQETQDLIRRLIEQRDAAVAAARLALPFVNNYGTETRIVKMAQMHAKRACESVRDILPGSEGVRRD